MDNWKTIAIGAVLTVMVGIIVTLAWNIFSKGTEATIAENPAFTEIHTELKAIREEIKSLSTQVTVMDLKFSTADARIEGRLELVVTQSNAILAAHQ